MSDTKKKDAKKAEPEVVKDPAQIAAGGEPPLPPALPITPLLPALPDRFTELLNDGSVPSVSCRAKEVV
jgi:hypothetical protein